jgi:hypothetical protein
MGFPGCDRTGAMKILRELQTGAAKKSFPLSFHKTTGWGILLLT